MIPVPNEWMSDRRKILTSMNVWATLNEPVLKKCMAMVLSSASIAVSDVNRGPVSGNGIVNF